MKTRDFRWTQKGKRVPEVERIFKKMWFYYDFYLEEAKDLPYWSTEMALVGNMAIAGAWAGFPAALEFYQDKPKKNKRQRADLWLGFSQSKDVIVEAKCQWLSWKSKLTYAIVNEPLVSAKRQLDRYLLSVGKKDQPAYCMSNLYTQFWMTGKDLKKEFSKKFELFISTANEIAEKERHQISFLAYYFLVDRKAIKKHPDKEYGYYYPGVIVWGRIWKPSISKRKQGKN